MTINKKLLWGYTVVLALLVLVTSVAIYALQRTESAYSALVDVNARIVNQVNRLGLSAREQVNHYRGALLYANDRQAYVGRLQDSRREFEDALGELGLLTSASGRLGGIEATQNEFQTLQDQGLTLVTSGQAQQDTGFGLDSVALASDRLVQILDQFQTEQNAQVAQARGALVQDARFLTIMMVIVSLIAIVAGLLIAVVLGRGITRQLQESAGVLSTSAAEILATTTQLAAGAAETNTAVSETTTTVEEVKQTAQVTSEKARQVLDTARKAAQVAQSGQESVGEAIDGMSQIQSQMEAIAESIVRLSEQSQSIGEIIVVVNDLAEQSNLLAVNAAIEATRAGEQGKGFAVVAQEVKSLAEQSKQATGQVRAILGDIQKATSSAVLATEQGNKAVDSGVKQSSHAGDVIRQLAEGVNEAAEAATQIAASSHQQMVGMDQVVLAMNNIKHASAQNAAGAKQAEGAAQSLHELGNRLTSLVGGARH